MALGWANWLPSKLQAASLGALGLFQGNSFPLGFVFRAADELRGWEVSAGSLSQPGTGWSCFAFGLGSWRGCLKQKYQWKVESV